MGSTGKDIEFVVRAIVRWLMLVMVRPRWPVKFFNGVMDKVWREGFTGRYPWSVGNSDIKY